MDIWKSEERLGNHKRPGVAGRWGVWGGRRWGRRDCVCGVFCSMALYCSAPSLKLPVSTCAPRPVALASLGNLLEMQILRPHPRHVASNSGDRAQPCFNKAPGDFGTCWSLQTTGVKYAQVGTRLSAPSELAKKNQLPQLSISLLAHVPWVGSPSCRDVLFLAVQQWGEDLPLND